MGIPSEAVFGAVLVLLLPAIHASLLEDPEAVSAGLERAEFLIQTERMEDAAELLQHLSSQAPVVEVALALSSVLDRMHKTEEAQSVRLQAILNAVAIRPQTSASALHWPWCKQMLQDIAYSPGTIAIKDQQMMRSEDDLSSGILFLSKVLVTTVCDYGAEIDPDNADMEFIAAVIHVLFGDIDKAIELVNQLPHRGFDTELRKAVLAGIWKSTVQMEAGAEASLAAADAAFQEWPILYRSGTPLAMLCFTRRFTRQFDADAPLLCRQSILFRASLPTVNPSELVPVVSWSHSSEVRRHLLHAHEADSFALSPSTEYLQNGDLIPKTFVDKDTFLVYLEAAACVYSSLPIVRTLDFLYVGMPFGQEIDSELEGDSLEDIVFLSGPTLIMANRECVGGLYLSLLSCFSRLATAVPTLAERYPELNLLVNADSVLAQAIDLIPGIEHVNVHFYNVSASYVVSKPMFVDFSLPESAETSRWERSDVFDVYRPSRASARLVRRLLRSDSLGSQDLSTSVECQCASSTPNNIKRHPRIVYVRSDSSSRGFDFETESRLLREIRTSLMGNQSSSSTSCLKVFDEKSWVSLSTRKHVFANADVLIGVHGDGMANMAWMSKGTAAVYVPVRPLVDVSFVHLAAALEVQLFVVEPTSSTLLDDLVELDNTVLLVDSVRTALRSAGFSSEPPCSCLGSCLEAQLEPSSALRLAW